VKNRYEPQIRALEKKQAEAVELDSNLGTHVKDAADVLRNLAKYYEKGGLKARQQIIGSIYPKKLVFEKNLFRTIELNEVVELICRRGKGSRRDEKEKTPEIGDQSYQVPRIGLAPLILILPRGSYSKPCPAFGGADVFFRSLSRASSRRSQKKTPLQLRWKGVCAQNRISSADPNTSARVLLKALPRLWRC
jgi:hypothetical protein